MSDFNIFMASHKIPKGNPEKRDVTHTRIGDKSLNIYGGSYNIPDDKLDEFYDLYHQHVVVKGNKEYLTEAQRNGDDAVLYIDFDFRYPLTQTERIEDFNDILQDLVSYVAIKANELMDTKEAFSLLIMIKPAVNVCEAKGYTKDGIHLVGNFTMPRHIQLELRNRLMKNNDFKQIITDIGATNSMDTVYDDGIVKGSTNTQLYGSRKPAHEAYEIIARLDCEDDEYEYKMVGSIDIDTFKTACVKYLDNKITVEYIDIPKPEPRAKRTPTARSGCPQTDETIIFDPCSILNIDDLNNALDLIMTPQMKKVCDFTLALPCEYSDDYAKWFDTACALKGDSENNFLVWMLFSSKSDKFDYNDIETYFEMWDEKILSYEQANEKFESGGYTFASICQWVKDHNSEQFAILQNKYAEQTPLVKASSEELNTMFDQVDEVTKKENDKNDIYNSISFKNCRKGKEFDFATFFKELYPNNFIYSNDIMYYYDGVNWQQDDKKKCCYVSNVVGKNFRKVFEDYVELRCKYKSQIPHDDIIRHEILKKEIQAYREISDNLAATSFRGNVVSDIKVVCYDPNVEFDTNGDLFCFKNKIFNLKTEEWVEPDPKYYNTISTGYDWQEPKDEDVKTIKDLIAQIFPHEDERTLYMVILATGLMGQTLEKFIIANGCGGNGKGVLDELAEDFFGDYAYNCANYVLLNPIKDGNNPTVANMSKKRIIFYREPNDNVTAQLNMGSIKELTGGNKINARLNYSNDTKTHLCGTHILEANGKPKISGKIDDAAMRRLIDIPFRSKFTKDYKDCYGDHVYDVNVFYKTAEFRNKYKCCMFKILLPYWSEFQKENRSIEPFICNSVIDRTNDYLESSDEVKTWFDEHYEQTKCPTDIIKIADVYELFQQSSLWDNMTKKERRTTTKKTFIKDFSESVFFRKFYKATEQSKVILESYNVSRMRNIIVGFKQIEDDIEQENRKLFNEMATKIGGF